MPYQPPFDLRGKRIENTYQQILQYSTASGLFYNGVGYEQDLSVSYAGVAALAINAITASNADVAVSSSWAALAFSASHADLSDTSLGINGLIIVQIPPDPTFSTSTNAIFGGVLSSNEGNPHAIVQAGPGGKVFGTGWGGNLWVITDPDDNFSNIITGSNFGKIMSDGDYCSATGKVYFCNGTNIYSVDPTTYVITSVYTNGFGVDGDLPPLKINGRFAYWAQAQPAPAVISKIDLTTNTLIATASWYSASVPIGGCHGASLTPDGAYFMVTNPSGQIAKVDTTTMTIVAVTQEKDPSNFGANLTDDCCVFDNHLYTTSEDDVYVYKLNVADMQWTSAYDNANSYGIWTDGSNVFMGKNASGQVYIYPMGDISNGPVIFALPTFGGNSPNELCVTSQGNYIFTRWLTGEIFRYSFPLFKVGINKYPAFTLDVAGDIQCTNENVTSQINVNNLIFSGTLHNTSSTFNVGQGGNLRVTSITGSQVFGVTTIASSSIWVGYITASMITASSGFNGTASWAVSSSWAPSSPSVSASYADFALSASFAVSASWAPGGVTTIDSASWASQSFSTSYSPWADYSFSSSWASQSLSASYALSSSYAVTSSYVTQSITQSIVSSSFSSQSSYAISASWASQSLSASWAPFTQAYQVSGSWASQSFSSSFATSASWAPTGLAQSATSASWASQSFSSSFATSASFAVSASWRQRKGVTAFAVSASYASASTTTSYSPFSDTATWATNSLAATNATNSLAATWATRSLTATTATSSLTATWATNSLSATTTTNSLAATVATNSLAATWATNSLSATTATSSVSSSWASQSFSSSFATTALTTTSASWATRSFYATSASWASQSLSASWAPGGVSAFATSASWASQSLSASWAPNNGSGSIVIADITAMTQSWDATDYGVNFFDYTKSLYTLTQDGMYRLDVVAVGWVTGSGNEQIFFGAKFTDELGSYLMRDDDNPYSGKGTSYAGPVTPTAMMSGAYVNSFRYYYSQLFSGQAGQVIEYYWDDNGVGLGDGVNPITFSMITKASIEKLAP